MSPIRVETDKLLPSSGERKPRASALTRDASDFISVMWSMVRRKNDAGEKVTNSRCCLGCCSVKSLFPESNHDLRYRRLLGRKYHIAVVRGRLGLSNLVTLVGDASQLWEY